MTIMPVVKGVLIACFCMGIGNAGGKWGLPSAVRSKQKQINPGDNRALDEKTSGPLLSITANPLLPPLGGLFIQHLPVTVASRNQLFNYMEMLQMNTVIIEAMREIKSGCDGNEYQWVQENSLELLRVFFAEASRRNKSVYVGLGSIRQQWTCKAPFYSLDYCQKDLKANFTKLKKLCDSSEFNGVCSGWYIPNEPRLTEWENPSESYQYYRQLVSIIRDENKDTRKILVSPFLAGAQDPGMVAKLARDFQNVTKVNIQLWQDSVGYAGTNLGLRPGPTLTQFYDALSGALGKENLWAVTELFNYGRPMEIESGGAYRPASIYRIYTQMSAASSVYVGKRIAWIPSTHMSNSGLAEDGALIEAPRLLAAYKAASGLQGKMIVPSSYYWNTPPGNQFRDPDNKKLFDKIVGDPLANFGQEWVGVPAWVSGGTQITLRFESPAQIGWIAAHVMRSGTSGINLPDAIKLDCYDNPNFPLHWGTWSRPEDIHAFAGETSEYVISNFVPVNKSCANIVVTLTGSTGWHFVSEIEVASP
jgi:hypothetical protein